MRPSHGKAVALAVIAFLGIQAPPAVAGNDAEAYVSCKVDGCWYNPGTTSAGTPHSTHVQNFMGAHNSRHEVMLREFEVDSNRRMYQAASYGSMAQEHPKYRSKPSCGVPPGASGQTKVRYCTSVWATRSGERSTGVAPLDCAVRDVYEYSGLLAGNVLLAVNVTETAAAWLDEFIGQGGTQQLTEPWSVPASPGADADAMATMTAMTHPEAECVFELVPTRRTSGGDVVWSGRLSDGVGCLIVQRADGVVLRGCGGAPNGVAFLAYSAGESARADLYALLPRGAKSLNIGGRTLDSVNGVVATSERMSRLLSALRD